MSSARSPSSLHVPFEIKYVPGKPNIVANAISRDLFVKPLALRLLSEPYFGLLDQVCNVKDVNVDLMFQSILHDNTICYYNTYTKSLMNDLCSAMHLAQENSRVEHKHHSITTKRLRGRLFH